MKSFWFVAILVCGRNGLRPFRFVAVLVGGNFGLWPFRFRAFRSAAVSVMVLSVCGRYDLSPIALTAPASKPR